MIPSLEGSLVDYELEHTFRIVDEYDDESGEYYPSYVEVICWGYLESRLNKAMRGWDRMREIEEAAAAAAVAAEEEAKAEEVRAAKKLKVAELRAALEELGQATDGLKAVLVERLVAARRAAVAAPAEPAEPLPQGPPGDPFDLDRYLDEVPEEV